MRLLIFATLCFFLFSRATADGSFPPTNPDDPLPKVSSPSSPVNASSPMLMDLPVEITANRLWTNSDLNLWTYQASCEGRFDCLFRPVLFLPLLGYNDSGLVGFFPFMSCGFLCRRQGIEYECYRDTTLFAVILQYSTRWQLDSFDVGTPQVLWSANRDRPVKDNATLEFSQDGNLILRDVDGTTVWSTNTSGSSVAAMKLTDTGSLVLVDGKNATVWTSLDHPTDTWFVGQTLREGQRLTANASATNSSRGQFYLSVVPGGLAAYIASDPPQLYYQLRYPFYDALNKSTYATFNKGHLRIFSSSFNYSDYIYLMNLTSMVYFMRLEYDGHLRHYGWRTDGWYLLSDVFELVNGFISSDKVVSTPLDYCSYPMVCGEYGICSNHECSCLDYTNFNLINRSQLNLGCSPVTPLSCPSTKNHQLVRFNNISYFNYNDMDAVILQGTNEEQCKQACLRNCSCKAALFLYAIDNRNGSCYLPSQLYSLMNGNPKVSGYSSVAHIKIQIDGKEELTTATTTTTQIIVIIVVAILGTIFSFSLAFVFIILRRRRRKKASKMENEDNFELIAGLRKRYSFEELKFATENFCQKLGQGGFGSVFLGTLNGEKVAVKLLDGVGQGMKEFLAEVNTIGNIHHINLVRLVGFCWEKSHQLLIYEYMCNGSLDKWIFCKNRDVVLDWKTRFQIIIDVARGLSYLHGDCKQRIAHFDIKPQNILLDVDFHAKVGDFGLSKLIDRELSHVLTRMRGTRGYLAPEWLSLKVTEKVDVYSFGVVIMEIICGRKNLDYSQPEECIHLITMLENKVQTNQLSDLIESNGHDILLPESEVIEMMKLAMWCLQINSARRPSMSMVVQVLEGSISVETDIDYNFTSITVHNVDRSASTSQSASLLSGPR